jgi:hypothetical protein
VSGSVRERATGAPVHRPPGSAGEATPDYFARRADGSPVVVDCRPMERGRPRDAAKFDATAKACESLGWECRLVGAPDPVVTANRRGHLDG